MAADKRTHDARGRYWGNQIIHLLLTVALFATAWVHAASYVYDANGRLRAVTNAAGQTSEYVYDALGNVLRACLRFSQ